VLFSGRRLPVNPFSYGFLQQPVTSANSSQFRFKSPVLSEFYGFHQQVRLIWWKFFVCFAQFLKQPQYNESAQFWQYLRSKMIHFHF